MKKHLLLLFFNWMRSKPEAKRTLKIFLIIGFVGFIFISGLVIWAGVSVYQVAKQQVQTLDVGQPLQQVEATIKSMPELTSPACWGKIQEMLNVEPWLTKPLFENWETIKGACKK